MNTIQQTTMIGEIDYVLAPEMVNLLVMTNEMLMKIKDSLKENTV